MEILQTNAESAVWSCRRIGIPERVQNRCEQAYPVKGGSGQGSWGWIQGLKHFTEEMDLYGVQVY